MLLCCKACLLPTMPPIVSVILFFAFCSQKRDKRAITKALILLNCHGRLQRHHKCHSQIRCGRWAKSDIWGCVAIFAGCAQLGALEWGCASESKCLFSLEKREAPGCVTWLSPDEKAAENSACYTLLNANPNVNLQRLRSSKRRLQNRALGLLLLRSDRARVQDGTNFRLAISLDTLALKNPHRIASSKTLFRFLCVRAEHSRYLCALISLAQTKA